MITRPKKNDPRTLKDAAFNLLKNVRKFKSLKGEEGLKEICNLN